MSEPFDELWGATIRSMRFDLAARLVMIDVELDAPLETVGLPGEPDRRVLFEGVSRLEWTSSDPAPWDYVELTEIHVAQQADHQSVVDMVFWAEPDGLHLVCDRVDIREI